MTDGDAPTCALCGLPAAGIDITDSAGNRFCCRGCRHVFGALTATDEVDLEQVRERRQSRAANERSDEGQPGHEAAYLTVDGMYCTSCEAFIEARASAVDGVSSARASYVTETLRVDHDPEQVSPDELESAVSGLGYAAYPRDDAQRAREAADWAFGRLAAGLLVGMAVMLQYLVIVYPTYFGGWLYDERTTAFFEEALASGGGRYFFVVIGVLTTVVLVFTGKPILRGAYVSLRTRTPNMDLLVALAAVSAYLYSTLAVALGRTDIYYDVTVMIILVVMVGGYHESAIKERALSRLNELTRVHVDDANRLVEGTVETVAVGELTGGDHIVVRSGERVPVDATVLDGEATIDESVITGESHPVTKGPEDVLVGGSIVLEGAVTAGVAEGATSSLDRVTELVWELQSSTHGIQGLANALATIFVPLVLGLAMVVTIVYLGLGVEPVGALLIGLTVLIVSCPCALGLATPLARAAGLRDAFEHDIVVFDTTVFERIREADTVVFDKTGTLTTGRMEVLESTIPTELFELVARLEERSSHPIAEAIVRRADFNEGTAARTPVSNGGTGHAVVGGRSLADEPIVEAYESHDRGVSGEVDERPVLVGHPTLFEGHGWSVDAAIRDTYDKHREEGRVPVVVGSDGSARGMIALGDQLRPGWDTTLDRLANRDSEVIVLTGDDEAAPFDEHPGVERVFTGVPPEGKAATVAGLAATGTTVMVGDGTNDAPALAAADLGIAMGGGTALAAEAADIALVSDDLRVLGDVFDLASGTGHRVKQNIGWAFIYNAIALPVAALGLLNPLVAALAMGTSSLLVVTNSSRAILDGERTDRP